MRKRMLPNSRHLEFHVHWMRIVSVFDRTLLLVVQFDTWHDDTWHDDIV